VTCISHLCPLCIIFQNSAFLSSFFSNTKGDQEGTQNFGGEASCKRLSEDEKNWGVNIHMELREIYCKDWTLMEVAQDRVQ
jgi:hypothetical protein